MLCDSFLNAKLITLIRCTCSEVCARKDTCDRAIATKKHSLWNWVKKSRECSRATHFTQGFSELRLKNSFAFACEPHNQDFTPLKRRKTKDAKLIGRMSDM